MEIVVPEVAAKQNNTKVKTSVKVPSSSEENLEAVSTKTPTKKKTNKKTPIKLSSHDKTSSAKKNQVIKDERQVLSEITPEKNIAPVYISPFVTVSRGKNSARKEYHKRHSLNDSQELQLEKNDVEVYTSPSAGAAYFRNILEETINRLQGMCKEWEAYKVKKNFLEYVF